MKQINNEYYAKKIFEIFEGLLNQFKVINNKKWGNPAGQTDEMETFEIKNSEGTIWCSLIEWVNTGTLETNRVGLIATSPLENKTSSLGHIVEVTIPFEFNRRFNTRAYEENGLIEIRNYGKFTVGRKGIKKKEFFDFLRKKNKDLINIDEENKEYITVFSIKDRQLSKEDFANSLIKFTYLIKEFKDQKRRV